MLPGCILFADNDPMFRSVRAEFLQDRYHVLEAGSIPEAEQHLRDGRVHLAILDIRMEDDNDIDDVSGLVFEKDAAYRAIPKIILTGFSLYEYMRDALGATRTGQPAAVDLLAKKEGPDALLQAVDNAFARHVRINWELDISINERQPVTFLHLATLIEPGHQGERLLHRAGELEDLFRHLFYEKNQIRIDRLLWQHAGRVALTILAFQDGTVPESFVVVCSQNTVMTEEAHRYRAHAPKALEGADIVLSAQAETMHFAANAYALASVDLEHFQTLAE